MGKTEKPEKRKEKRKRKKEKEKKEKRKKKVKCNGDSRLLRLHASLYDIIGAAGPNYWIDAIFCSMDREGVLVESMQVP